MKFGIVLLLLWGCWQAAPVRGQEDFLTPGEVDGVRDKQEPDKRIVLYLDFARRRLDVVKAGLASDTSRAGRDVQKQLKQYVSILDAIDMTIEQAREDRIPTGKALEELEKQGKEFLQYLESINKESSPRWEDYRFMLAEAIDVTQDELEQAGIGAFPEVDEREAPAEFPSAPPPPSSSGSEEGPPRKSRRR